jgi:hypothetical protein
LAPDALGPKAHALVRERADGVHRFQPPVLVQPYGAALPSIVDQLEALERVTPAR